MAVKMYTDIIRTAENARAEANYLTGDYVEAEVKRLYIASEHKLSDAMALVISSWWQSPGTEGRAFAQLASTGAVSASALLDNINAVRSGEGNAEKMCLDMLATWAINHPSRKISNPVSTEPETDMEI